MGKKLNYNPESLLNFTFSPALKGYNTDEVDNQCFRCAHCHTDGNIKQGGGDNKGYPFNHINGKD